MEMADLVAINKADGNNLEKAGMAMVQYRNALHLFPPKESGWEPQVMTCSAWTKTGIPEIWEALMKYRKMTETSGYFRKNRNDQARYWMYETIEEQLKSGFFHHPVVKDAVREMEAKVLRAELSSFEAARQLLEIYLRAKATRQP